MRSARVVFSLRVKIFLLIGLSLAPLVGFQAYDIRRLRDQRLDEAKTLALNLARDGAERQRGLVSQASAILDVAVELPAIRTADVAGCRAFLKQVKSNSPWADTFGLIDLRGYPVCGNNDTVRQADLSDREYFKQALVQDRVYVSGFLVARVTGRPNVVLSRAVRNYAGEVSGVLIATVDLGWLKRLVGEVAQDGKGRTLLMDRYGTVLARVPDDERLVGRNIAHLSDVARVLGVAESAGESAGADGIVRIRAVTTIAGSGEKLVVAFDKALILAEADAELGRNQWRIATLVLLAALLAWLGSELLVLRWIRRLTAAADKLGRGEFAIRADIPATAGELATVGRRLEAAGAHLGERDSALRRAEAEGRDANSRLLMAEEIARIGHWRVELPSRTLLWSDGVYRLHGHTHESYVPSLDTAIECYHPDDRAEVAALVADAVAQGRSFDFALRIVRADGELRDVVSRGLCEIGPNGAPTAIFGTIMDVTELRRAEREAHETSALLGATLESMDEGLLVVSAAGRVEMCNTRANALLGLPHELTAPKPSAQSVLAYQWATGEFEGADDSVRQMMRGRGAIFGLHRYVRTRPNGTVLEVRSMPIAGSGGVVRTYTDITARRQAEAAVAESEARYRLLAESTSDVITRLGLDFRRDYVSPACRRLLGWEPDEMMGQQPSGAMHPDDAPAVRALAAELVSGTLPGGRCTATYRARHKDGRWIWIEAGMMLAHDAAGHPTSIVCSLRDIGERMAAEAARQESEARYRLLADHSSDLVALRPRRTDRRSYVSPSAFAMLGYRPEELVDLPVSAFVHPDDLAGMEEKVASLSAETPQIINTHRIRRKDGRWIWIEAVFRLTDAGSPDENIIVRARDVTELQRQAAHLEKARGAAEAAAKAKSEFLANMSHELRTPLTGMLGVHDILDHDRDLGDTQRRLVKLAQEAGRSLLAIVNDVLDFSKIDAGQMAVEHVPFGLRALIESCRELGAAAIGPKPVRLSAEVAPDLPDALLGDASRIRQVVLNLTTNAIKFTHEGAVTLRADVADGRLRIAISDTGIGIEAGQIPHLFERFSQADGSTARRFGGTGLGLAICKRLVELMSGSIGVTSEPGRGSTFWFELPLDRAAPAGTADREAASPARAVRARRLLVAEDNTLNQEIVRTVLTRQGHDVTMVSDGATALDLFRAGAFDLVLMDVQMPGMDGLTATAAIRALEAAERRRRTPIVALTANATADEAERCRAAGMDAHVAKPIDWTELFTTIDRLGGPVGHATAFAAGAGPSVLDERILDTLADLLSRERVGDLLAAFRLETERRLAILAEPVASSGALRQHAHSLVSLAGQLGFIELSSLCMELELSSPAGEALDELPRLQIAAARAIDAAAGSSYAKAA